jgi:hypothetical protein
MASKESHMEPIGELDACGQQVSVPLVIRAIETATARTIVSHPMQYEAYRRAAPVSIIFSGRASNGIEWKQSVDMPEDCIYLETPDGGFLIKNLATQP